eukprot:4773816-Amphidinium_carterae.1
MSLQESASWSALHLVTGATEMSLQECLVIDCVLPCPVTGATEMCLQESASWSASAPCDWSNRDESARVP